MVHRIRAASRSSFRKTLYTGILVALVFASVGRLLMQFELNDIGSPLLAGWFAGIVAVFLMYLKPLMKAKLSDTDRVTVTSLNIYSPSDTPRASS